MHTMHTYWNRNNQQQQRMSEVKLHRNQIVWKLFRFEFQSSKSFSTLVVSLWYPFFMLVIQCHIKWILKIGKNDEVWVSPKILVDVQLPWLLYGIHGLVCTRKVRISDAVWKRFEMQSTSNVCSEPFKKNRLKKGVTNFLKVLFWAHIPYRICTFFSTRKRISFCQFSLLIIFIQIHFCNTCKLWWYFSNPMKYYQVSFMIMTYWCNRLNLLGSIHEGFTKINSMCSFYRIALKLTCIQKLGSI